MDYRGRAGLDRARLASLASCEWIRQSQNLLIHGACGAGKTYLACALAQQACRAGLSAWYVRTPRLFEELSLCHADGSFRKRLAAIAKINLVIIDDFAINPIGPRERNYLLELLDDRLIHCSHKIHLHGKESMRERASKKAGKGSGDGEVTVPSTRPRRRFCPLCGRSDSPTASP
ncbi:MAG: ATP-binding protein [Acidimicrobiales bacterium]